MSSRSSQPGNPKAIQAALEHLRADPVLRSLIERIGPFQLTLERDRFKMLVRSIVWQQISFRAASAIFQRFKTALGGGRITAGKILALSPARFRAAGLSSQKTAYLVDLAQKAASGEVRLKFLAQVPDQEVIDQLTRIKGIGVWTAQMFLIFSLGRLDVFPFADLGIRMALRNLYRLPELPGKKESLRLTEHWRPYSTVGSWYCWRSLDAPTPFE